jgi:replicative DNA helicase
MSLPETELDLESAAPKEVERYKFDDAFQDKIAALMLRDTKFLQRTEGLIEPGFLEEASNGIIADMALRYYAKYKKAPGDITTVKAILRDDMDAKLIRGDFLISVVDRFKKEKPRYIYEIDVSDRDFVVDKVAEFARHQAVANAILASAELLETKRDFESISKLVKKALDVGAHIESGEYDYFAAIEQRTTERKERAAGLAKPTGITTGYAAFDAELYHSGWGRGELSVYLGGAKAGKTTALISHGVSATAAGFNVLYVTLEVAAKIIGDRMDANIADQVMMEMGSHILEVDSKVREFQKKAGRFIIREYPSGSMTVSTLRRMIEHYKSQGIVFDLVIVDYADLMAPERYTDNAIENSKNVYVNLRGLAMQEGFALLTATQTNREGFKSAVAKAEHVSEDFNKIRIADLVISINKTDEERAVGEARLYFAASRNQAGNFTIRIQQDVDRMKFITKILGKD